MYKRNTCGAALDRDVNAVNNLSGYGLRSVPCQEEVSAVTRGSYAGDNSSFTAVVCSKQVEHKTRADRPVTAATLP